MKLLKISCLLLLVLAAGCKPNSVGNKSAEPNAKSYNAHGIVRQIASDRHSATIQHDAIPGYMPAMTMDFNVRATNELKGIAPSDEISFKLVVGEDDSWIEDVRFISHRIEHTTGGVVVIHMPTAELKPGDPLPDYAFTSETGRRIHISDFRGKVLAFTFFFTRCPLPDYCPRMSKDFAAARQLLVNTPNAPTNWQFLSISFDPANDTPETLTSYAEYFRDKNPDRWLFAAADTSTLAKLEPELDLMVARNGESISHNLRTVVVNPEGRIACQLDGNQWTPEQLAAAMTEAAGVPASGTAGVK